LLFPFLFGSHIGGLRGLGGLGFGEPLLEFVNASGGIDEFLRAGVKGMAGIANADDGGLPGGPCFDHVATGATNFGILVFGMNLSSHKKGRKG
jgi:hypothetical protein